MALTKVSGSILKDPLNLGEVSIGGTLTYEDVTNIDSIGIITARSGVDASGTSIFRGPLQAQDNLEMAGELVHLSDNDTRIRFPANDTISFQTAGSERFRIDSSGRVLIGTTTEGNASADDLTIAGSDNVGITIRSGTAHQGGIYFSDATSGNAEFDGFIVYDQNSRELRFGTQQATRARFDAGGNLGINEVSPDRKLHVRSDGAAAAKLGGESGAAYYMEIGQLASSGSPGFNATGSSTSMLFQLNGSEKVRIDSSGRLLVATNSASATNSGADDLVIGNTSQGNNGMTIVTNNANIGGIYFADQDNSVRGGVRYQHGSDLAQFYAGGSVVLNLKNKGVGINETSPTEDALVIRGGDTDDTPKLILKRHTDGAQSDGEIIGKIQFMSNENNVDSGNHQPRAEIHGVTVSTSGAAKMDFYTVPNSTTTPLKRMTINQLGQVTTPNQPSFMANFGGNNNVSHNNGDYLKANSTDHNTGNCYSTGNYRFTAPVAGNYLFYGRANMSGVTTNEYARSFQVRLYKNNSSEQFHMSRTTLTGYSGSYPDTSTMVCSINLAANDYVQLKVNWETDGNGISSTENLHHHGSMFGGYLIG